MEASEADLILLADVEQAEAFMQKLGLLYFIKNHGQEMKELALSLDKKHSRARGRGRSERRAGQPRERRDRPD